MHLQAISITSLLSTLITASSAAIANPQTQHLSHPFFASPNPNPESNPNALKARTTHDETTATTTTTTHHSSSSSKTTTSSTSTSTPTHKNHNIAVAENGTLFIPSTLHNITLFSTLTFYFYPQNYSVIQSSFSSPCHPLTYPNTSDQHPIFSGFEYTSTSGISRAKFVLNITSTEPLWIYGFDGDARATKSAGYGGSVCEKGMVMVVNPVKNEGVKEYVKNAASANKGKEAKAPKRVWGGERIEISERTKEEWDGRHKLNTSATATAAGMGTDSEDDVTDASASASDDNNDDEKSGSGSGSATSAGTATGTNVTQTRYASNAVRVRGMKTGNSGEGLTEKSFMAVVVLVGAGVFGLGL